MDTEDELDQHLIEEINRLRDTQPASDLWPGIAQQLEPRRIHRTLLIRWPTAIAAGLVIAAATSVGTAVLLHRTPRADSIRTTTIAQLPAPASVPASFAPGDAALARAVGDLERAVRNNLDNLDPEARASVTKSLSALDQAIAQATRRQIAAPGDPGVARYLTSTLRKKLQLLRTVSQLTQLQS